MTWDEETFFNDGDRYFEALERELAHAQASIDLETYIFDDDVLGHRIARALGRAAQRGVRVRLLVDGFGSAGWTARFASELVHAGVSVKVYHPLPWSLLVAPLSRFPWLTRVLLMAANMNRRNHRKTCVIDGRVAWLGSMNITADHLSGSSGGRFRDTGVRVSGEAVAELTWAFERAWSSSWRGVAGTPRASSGLVRINVTRAQRRAMNHDLLLRIDSARRRIWLTNAYFVPNRRLIRALERAARRGVDVRVLVPNESDVFFMRWLTRAFYQVLVRAGVHIFEFGRGILHAKSFVIDDAVFLGSSNLNHRSIIHDLEADVLLCSEASLRALEVRFLYDQNQSRQVSMATDDRPGLLERLAARLLFPLRYWL